MHCHLCTSCYDCTADISVGGNSTQTGRIVSGTADYASNISIGAKADQIGQEGVEIFKIPLSVTSEELAVPVFVEGPAMITVSDRSGEEVTVAHYCIDTHSVNMYCSNKLLSSDAICITSSPMYQ